MLGLAMSSTSVRARRDSLSTAPLIFMGV
jgi:hypothetical protein